MLDSPTVPKTRGETKDFLLRDLPVELADKVKVAAALYSTAMKDYIRDVLARHIQGLEKKGVKLTLDQKSKRQP
jgi:plasmid stability protein